MNSDLPTSFDECSTLTLRKGDYVSPGLRRVVLDACFPKMKEGDINSIPNPLFRKNITHTWYIDPDFPYCGFLSRDEAHILYNLALKFVCRGRCLEIGSHVGWSTVHLALAGIQLDVVEPQLSQDPRILLSVIDALRRAGVQKNVNLVPGYSPEAVDALVEKKAVQNALNNALNAQSSNNHLKWGLIFIDGNHDAEGPLKDAIVAERHADVDSLVIFHDLAFPDVARGWRHFVGREGWSTRIYHTQQIMGIAWRGNVTPLDHYADPSFDWTLPDHLTDVSHLAPILKHGDDAKDLS